MTSRRVFYTMEMIVTHALKVAATLPQSRESSGTPQTCAVADSYGLNVGWHVSDLRLSRMFVGSLPWGTVLCCWKAFVFIDQDETIKKRTGIDWLELSVCWGRGSHPSSASERWRFKTTGEWTSQVGNGCLTFTVVFRTVHVELYCTSTHA